MLIKRYLILVGWLHCTKKHISEVLKYDEKHNNTKQISHFHQPGLHG